MTPSLDINSIFSAILHAMSPLEMAAAVTSLLCVWLTVRNNIWNWLWGFIGVVLYGIVFYRQQLYANAALQILYYMPIQFIGFYVWLRTGPNKNDDLPVSVLTTRERLIAIGAMVGLSVVFYFALKDWLPALFPKIQPDPQAGLDGITTAVSIVAQYLQVPKKFENWILWFGVDVAYVELFIKQKPIMWPSLILYIIFVGLAAKGMLDWTRILRQQAEAKNLAAQAAAEEESRRAEPIRPSA